jgi:hypothetical protein
MQTKECPSCQQPVELQATRCASCGHMFRGQFVNNQTRFDPVAPSKKPASSGGAKSRWVIVVLVAVVAIVAVVVVFMKLRHA